MTFREKLRGFVRDHEELSQADVEKQIRSLIAHVKRLPQNGEREILTRYVNDLAIVSPADYEEMTLSLFEALRENAITNGLGDVESTKAEALTSVTDAALELSAGICEAFTAVNRSTPARGPLLFRDQLGRPGSIRESFNQVQGRR